MTNNLTDITAILQILGIGIAALVVLLLVIRILEIFLRRLAKRHVEKTDLDMIGRQAVVTQTIRPRRPGKITYQNEAGADTSAAAASDQTIRRGRAVLINAIDGSQLRVSPLEAAVSQESSPNK